MPRPRPPHLHRETSRHGKTVWYVRVDKGPRIRPRSEFGTADFQTEYQDAVAGKIRPTKDTGPLPERSLGSWRVTASRAHGWRSQWRRANSAKIFLRQDLGTAGTEPFAGIDRKAIIAGRERRAATPFQARHFLDTRRQLFPMGSQGGTRQVRPLSLSETYVRTYW
jgi:hypothetical protein